MWSDDGSTSIEFYIDLSLLRCLLSSNTLRKGLKKKLRNLTKQQKHFILITHACLFLKY